MTEDELKAMEQRTERVFGHSIQDRDVLALCREVRRLTAELAELRTRPTLGQVWAILTDPRVANDMPSEAVHDALQELCEERVP